MGLLLGPTNCYQGSLTSPKKAVANLGVEFVKGSASRAGCGSILLNSVMAICVRSGEEGSS